MRDVYRGALPRWRMNDERDECPACLPTARARVPAEGSRDCRVPWHVRCSQQSRMTLQQRWWFWTLLVCGCGSVTAKPLPDGGAPGDDGGGRGTTRVQLTVLSTSGDGAPDTAAIAVFQDPSGATIADGLVDGNGHAQADMPLGGSITVIRITDASDTVRDAALTTIRGVHPGDQIAVGATESPAHATGGSSTMTASFTPFSAGDTYAFYTACGSTGGSGGTAQLPFVDSCHGATFDLLSVAQSSSDPADVRYVYQTGLAYRAGGSVAVPNAWSTAASFTATLTHVPSSLADISVTRSTLLGAQPAAPSTAVVTQPAPGVVTATTPYPADVGNGAVIELALHHENAAGFQVFDVRTPGVAATQGIDLGQLVLPWIVAAPTGTLTGASWDQLEGGTPDVRLVTWNGHWSDGARTVFLSWTFEDGDHTTSLTLPALPTAYAAYDPARQIGVTVGRPQVTYLDVDVLDGYDAARRYGPAIGDPLSDLGVLTDRAVQRRTSRTPFTR